jgi:hypothetical protein
MIAPKTLRPTSQARFVRIPMLLSTLLRLPIASRNAADHPDAPRRRPRPNSDGLPLKPTRHNPAADCPHPDVDDDGDNRAGIRIICTVNVFHRKPRSGRGILASRFARNARPPPGRIAAEDAVLDFEVVELTGQLSIRGCRQHQKEGCKEGFHGGTILLSLWSEEETTVQARRLDRRYSLTPSSGAARR